MSITAEAVGKNADELVRHVASRVGTVVTYATPVDTSRARMNWQGSVNVPAIGVLMPYPLRPLNPLQGPAVALSSIKAATDQYKGQQGGIWITNNLQYIQLLNDGSSSQAPINFVAQAVLAGLQSIKEVKLLDTKKTPQK